MNGRVVTLADYRRPPRLRSAIGAFFADKQLSAKTRRAYSQALSAVAETVDGTCPSTSWILEGCSMPSRSGGGRRNPPPGTPGSPLSSSSSLTANATDG